MAAQVVGSQGRVLAIEVGHGTAVTYATMTYHPMTYSTTHYPLLAIEVGPL